MHYCSHNHIVILVTVKHFCGDCTHINAMFAFGNRIIYIFILCIHPPCIIKHKPSERKTPLLKLTIKVFFNGLSKTIRLETKKLLKSYYNEIVMLYTMYLTVAR